MRLWILLNQRKKAIPWSKVLLRCLIIIGFLMMFLYSVLMFLAAIRFITLHEWSLLVLQGCHIGLSIITILWELKVLRQTLDGNFGMCDRAGSKATTYAVCNCVINPSPLLNLFHIT